jgi:hypothetical protein
MRRSVYGVKPYLACRTPRVAASVFGEQLHAAIWGVYPIDETPADCVVSLSSVKQEAKGQAMKMNNSTYEPKHAVKGAPKIKTVGLQLGVTDRDLEAKIKRAFDLAKSGGRELNLTFCFGDPGRSALRQLPVE